MAAFDSIPRLSDSVAPWNPQLYIRSAAYSLLYTPDQSDTAAISFPPSPLTPPADWKQSENAAQQPEVRKRPKPHRLSRRWEKHAGRPQAIRYAAAILDLK